jgi:FkbM family methyltransferase
MKIIKKFIKYFISRLINWLMIFIPKTRIGNYIYQEIIKNIMKRNNEVVHKNKTLKFCLPNKLNERRFNTFATKEPETLKWIESIPQGSILWDIGANIGLYSVYAAKSQNCKVFAFEPSVFNLELLARNIALNKLQKSISIIPIALSDQIGMNLFKMSNTEWGGALSTFGENFGQDGKELKQMFEYQTTGLSMDNACEFLKIPQPDFLKMDVDGLEHFILRGGLKTLSLVEGVLIEINDMFIEQAKESSTLLKKAGLVLHKKCDLGVSKQFNQWWIRPINISGN